MRTFAHKPKATRETTSAESTMPVPTHFGQTGVMTSIRYLQRAIGNQAVQQMLQTHTEDLNEGSTDPVSPRFGHDFSRTPVHASGQTSIQPKLRVGGSEDKYEQEADQVANQFMQM